MTTPRPGQALLERMLARLHASMASGPAMNCRPARSRQRLDLRELEKLGDLDAQAILRELLEHGKVKIVARHEDPGAPPPPASSKSAPPKEPRDREEPAESSGAPESGDAPELSDAPDPSDAPESTPAPEATESSETPEASDPDQSDPDQSDPDQSDPGETAPESSDPGAPAGEGTAAELVVADASARTPVLDADTAVTAEVDPADGREEAREHEEQLREHARAKRAFDAQLRLLGKCRHIAADARTYLQDTGSHALYVGLPVLSAPPSQLAGRESRVLAPLALVPVQIQVTAGARPAIALECSEKGEERLVPNPALLAWLSRLTGESYEEPEIEDEADNPLLEIDAIRAFVARALELEGESAAFDPFAQEGGLRSLPATSDLDALGTRILPGAVLGLFPLAKQSILADVDALVRGEEVLGPLQRFLTVDLSATPSEDETREAVAVHGGVHEGHRDPAAEHFVSRADPCQQGAVLAAREQPVLVVHGPPGTGKSQTITNIIGDHLARGQRVLFVSDKRTALDVVKHRLDHLGLGELCAVVHDARRDRTALYRDLKDQLGGLAELDVPEPERELGRVNDEVKRLHGEVADHAAALAAAEVPGVGGLADLVGRWFELRDAAPPPEGGDALRELDPEAARACEGDLRDALTRGLQVGFAANPWVQAEGVSLNELMARPVHEIGEVLQALVSAARTLDAADVGARPPFVAGDLEVQAQAREDAARLFARAREVAGDHDLAAWISAGRDRRRRAASELAGLAAQREQLTTPLDREILLATGDGDQLPTHELGQMILALEDYLRIASSWHAFFHFGTRSRARAVLEQLSLPAGAAAAERGKAFLEGLRARVLLRDVVHDDLSLPGQPELGLTDDQELARRIGAFEAVEALVQALEGASNAPVREALAAAGSDGALLDGLSSALQQAGARVAAILAFERAGEATRLLGGAFRARLSQRARAGETVTELVEPLHERRGELEGVLQAQVALQRLPGAARGAVESMLLASCDPDAGWRSMLRVVLRAAIDRRLAEHPQLLAIDEERLRTCQTRCNELDAEKRDLERDMILAGWRRKQRERLLVGTGSRLNGDGAELRRRLVSRGRRSMPLRRTIQLGLDPAKTEGDPLYDLRPVWLASPETVAQVFPRSSLFDLLVFDEASQVRLEEALPLLTRARRVLVAGDPKQLPPTRFFEATLTESTDDLEEEDDQGLFEAQQSEVEDLLTAALNLDVDHAYLDVHYRSANPGLIEFSNRHFYGSRLQPRPLGPDASELWLPIELRQVGGTYENRRNEDEATAVVELVAELLAEPEPPSIGIACFNLNQRDLIVDRLAERAAADREFETRLAEAQERSGDDSFEGLFVKNLESVQGDERDHMIISTTYGPNPEGKFYRRFGPLGRVGGGRRLNVLVTRARRKIHLLTSIPAEAYGRVDELPPGEVPNGGWFLFAYLRFAEELASLHEQVAGARVATARSEVEPPALARAIADALADREGVDVTVGWGSRGFGFDLVLAPTDESGRALGVHIDTTRFDRVASPARWDGYRRGMLTAAGWPVHRLLSPHFARDPEASLDRLLATLARA